MECISHVPYRKESHDVPQRVTSRTATSHAWSARVMSRTATCRITLFLYILRKVCCSVLHSVAVCCSVLQCVALCGSMLQCAAAQHTATHCNLNSTFSVEREQTTRTPSFSEKCVAVCCSVLQCVAVYINSTFSVEREPTNRTPSRENLNPDARETKP